MRRSKVKRRRLLPDPKFNEVLVTRFANNMMLDGKKSTSLNILYDALDIVEKKKDSSEEKSSVDIWKDALTNIMPHVKVKSKRVGGANYQIPVQIDSYEKVTLSIKWMIQFSRKRNEKSMAQRLASEIMAAYKEEGASVKKKIDTHKMAEANKAFAHFRV